MITFDALNVDTLSAINCLEIVSSARFSDVVVKLVARTVSENIMPVLMVLAITVLILR